MRKLIIRRIIYKTTNNINGKIYIGRSGKGDSKYLGSGKYLLHALNKYGKQNFKRVVIDNADNRKELCEKEIFWINFYDARNPEIGYNIGPGGEGAGSGKDHPHYGVFGENHPRYGKRYHHSKETITRMSLDRRGENINNYGKTTSEETKQKMRDSLIGRKLSEEHKQNIKMGLRLSGKNSAHQGKAHSEETKEKMRIARKKYWENIREKN